MNSTSFSQPEQPITEQDIEEVERKYHFKFPDDFKKHYLTFNGGCPQKNLFKKTTEDLYEVQQFLSIKYGSGGTIEHSIEMLKVMEKILPEDLIPFACDSGGDDYCFSIRPEDYGKIYVWRQEYYDDPERAVEYLAPSLSDFINNMVEDTEESNEK